MNIRKIILSVTLGFMLSSLQSQTWNAVTIPVYSGVEQMLIANNNLYLAGWEGIYKTSDGSTWASCTTGISSTMGLTYNSCLCNFNNTLYSGARNKCYRSTDWGDNWAIIPGVDASPSSNNTDLVISGDTQIFGWDGTAGGVKTSFDNGQNWTFTALPYVSKHITKFNGYVFVKNWNGVHRSTDHGLSFSALSGGLPSFSGSAGGLIESNGILVCAIFQKGVYISQDAGASWSKRTLSNGITTDNTASLTQQGGLIFCGATNGEAFFSSDHGLNWTNITGTGIPVNETVKCFAMYNNELYAGTGAGLYKTSFSSIRENICQADEEVIIFPNPASEYIRISYTESRKLTRCSLTDASGKKIREFSFSNNPCELWISDLKSGVYLLQLRYDDNSTVCKTIIVD